MSVAYEGCQRQAPPIEREGFYLDADGNVVLASNIG